MSRVTDTQDSQWPRPSRKANTLGTIVTKLASKQQLPCDHKGPYTLLVRYASALSLYAPGVVKNLEDRAHLPGAESHKT